MRRMRLWAGAAGTALLSAMALMAGPAASPAAADDFGAISGTVTSERDGSPGEVNVLVLTPDGAGVTGSAVNADGSYSVDGLPGGNYVIWFVTPYPNRHIAEYYNDSPFIERATLVPVLAGQTTTGIDASLRLRGVADATYPIAAHQRMEQAIVEFVQPNPWVSDCMIHLAVQLRRETTYAASSTVKPAIKPYVHAEYWQVCDGVELTHLVGGSGELWSGQYTLDPFKGASLTDVEIGVSYGSFDYRFYLNLSWTTTGKAVSSTVREGGNTIALRSAAAQVTGTAAYVNREYGTQPDFTSGMVTGAGMATWNLVGMTR